ncbi:MAG TPA: hypothetical protein VM818_16170 [Vicinamibacterales bacterium]|jgi:hypothetical protein|nr:hypothetical protein [Vicinamibacterales bacterium]
MSTNTGKLVTIGELAIARERARRTLMGHESSGAYMAARDSRRALAQIDAELNAAVDGIIAEETAALASK